MRRDSVFRNPQAASRWATYLCDVRGPIHRYTLARLLGGLALALSAAGAAQGPLAQVRVHDHVALQLAASDGSRSAASRAAEASKVLTALVDGDQPGAMLVEVGPKWARLRFGDREVLRLVPADAELAGAATLGQYATRVQAELTDFLATERQRARLQNGVLRSSLVVFFAVLGYLLLCLFLSAVRTLEHRLVRDQSGLPADLQRLARGPWRNLAMVGLVVARLIGALAAGFAVLIASFSLFDSTRVWRDRLAAGAAEPFSAFLRRLSGALPNLLLLVLLGVVLRYGWHTVSHAFERAAAAPADEGGLAPDRVKPYRLLARAALVLFALMILPFVLGDRGGLLTSIGLVVAAACALASLPLVATVAIGTWALWTRQYRVGEWLRVRLAGGHELSGEVVAIDFTHLRLVPEKGGDIRVPHLSLLFAPVVHLPAARPLTVELPVARDRLSPAAALRLLELAAGAVAREHGLATSVVVRLVEVTERAARFSVALPGAPDSLRNELLLALLDATAHNPLDEVGAEAAQTQ